VRGQGRLEGVRNLDEIYEALARAIGGAHRRLQQCGRQITIDNLKLRR
jgi:hypothetical protein